MDSVKSKLSLSLLKGISSILKANSDKITLSTSKEFLVTIKDNNPNYDFFFRIDKEELSKEKNMVIVSSRCRPFSEVENGANDSRFLLPDFLEKLNQWFKNIETYKIEKLIEDRFEKQYQEEFYRDFKIIDEDALTNSFNFQQQLLLNKYIERVEEHLNLSEELTKEEKDELLNESHTLKREVSTETKDNYLKQQSLFWAKIRKKSIKLCEFAIKEFSKEVIKEFVKRGITITWDSLPLYIEQTKTLLN